MTTNKTVSVVMATYNGAKYIREQLDSIIAQTYPIHELIIQDDCSTDSTVATCREYEAKYPFVHVYVNERNKGFKDNFQCAISQCSNTDYVALCDQDDKWTPDHIQHLVENIGTNSVACANSVITNENGNSVGLTLAEQQSFSYIPNDDCMKVATILLWRNPYQGSTMLLSRDFVEKALPLPQDVNFHDAWFALLACFTGGMTYSFHPISYYRMHGNNASGDKMKRLSRFGAYSARIRGLKAGDRIAMIGALEDRVPEMSPKQCSFICRMKQYFTNNGFMQMVSNACYLTVHFRSIFTI